MPAYGSNVVDGRVGEWMQVNSGGRFFPLDPRPEEIDIEDIANGLALTCRYGGQGNIDEFYSVAEHSLLMSQYAVDAGMSYGIALGCLLHDAAEAYTGDMVRAMKHSIGEPFSDIEDNIQNVVFKMFGVDNTFLLHGATIKDLDMRITRDEKSILFSTDLKWATDDLEPLGVRIKCHQPQVIFTKFLNQFSLLTTALEGAC